MTEEEKEDLIYRALVASAENPCSDSRGVSGWTCREFDGTGLWCPGCLAKEALAVCYEGDDDPEPTRMTA